MEGMVPAIVGLWQGGQHSHRSGQANDDVVHVPEDKHQSGKTNEHVIHIRDESKR